MHRAVPRSAARGFRERRGRVCVYGFEHTHTHTLLDRWGVYLLDHVEDIRLQLLRAVGAHTQVQFVGVLRRLERLRHTQDGVRRRLRSSPPRSPVSVGGSLTSGVPYGASHSKAHTHEHTSSSWWRARGATRLNSVSLAEECGRRRPRMSHAALHAQWREEAARTSKTRQGRCRKPPLPRAVSCIVGWGLGRVWAGRGALLGVGVGLKTRGRGRVVRVRGEGGW